MENLGKCKADSQTNECGGFLPMVSGQAVLFVEQIGNDSRWSALSEPFSFSSDGHIVGRDGFVVPKDFDEFYERNPMGVRRWLTKRLHKVVSDDTLMELEQELLLHLCSLPEKSKYRKRGTHTHVQGCTDRIQCFDPIRQHGASAKRFFNYVSLCLTNRLYTILSRQTKNLLCNEQNLSITDSAPDDAQRVNSRQQTEVGGEYLYHHSATARRESDKAGWQANVQLVFVQEFMDFVEKEAPQLMAVVEAIACTGTLREARESLGLTTRAFEGHRNSINALKDRFMTGKGSYAVTRQSRVERMTEQRERAGWRLGLGGTGRASIVSSAGVTDNPGDAARQGSAESSFCRTSSRYSTSTQAFLPPTTSKMSIPSSEVRATFRCPGP